MYEVFCDNAKDASGLLHPNFYQAIVTSPPYFGLRVYGDDEREVGANQTLDEYIDELVGVFESLKFSLRDDGVLWVNIGDCYNGSTGAGTDYHEGGRKEGKNKWGMRSVQGLAPKNLIGVPWRFALAMQEAGWILRSEVVWWKTKAYPQQESYIKRPIPAHETVFMFSKSPDYQWNATGKRFSVWRMSPTSRNPHEAPFPLQLPMECILASTNEGDWVLDPFAGSGTTGEAALICGRSATLIELYPESAEVCRQRLAGVSLAKDVEWV